MFSLFIVQFHSFGFTFCFGDDGSRQRIAPQFGFRPKIDGVIHQRKPAIHFDRRLAGMNEFTLVRVKDVNTFRRQSDQFSVPMLPH